MPVMKRGKIEKMSTMWRQSDFLGLNERERTLSS